LYILLSIGSAGISGCMAPSPSGNEVKEACSGDLGALVGCSSEGAAAADEPL